MPTQNNTITKDDLKDLQNEIREDMRHNHHIVLLIIGAVLVALIACFIAAVLMLVGVYGGINDIADNVGENRANIHALQNK